MARGSRPRLAVSEGDGFAVVMCGDQGQVCRHGNGALTSDRNVDGVTVMSATQVANMSA